MIVISEGNQYRPQGSEYVDFFANGFCGQCPPCKGGGWISRLPSKVNPSPDGSMTD